MLIKISPPLPLGVSVSHVFSALLVTRYPIKKNLPNLEGKETDSQCRPVLHLTYFFTAQLIVSNYTPQKNYR